MKQQNKNFVLNVGYQLLMYLFPLITAAYVSRALGAECIGVYSYVNSIVTVCGMFCLLGISNYGNREVAKVRDNGLKLSEVFSSVYTLQLLLSSGVLLIYLFTVFLAPISYRLIFIIQIFHILSVTSDVTWLFFGLEKFKITLTRNFIVKFVSMLFIVIFVKSESDLWIYALIMSLSSFLSQGFLLLLSRKVVNFRLSSFKAATNHLKSCCILFIPVIAFNIYRIMDKTMIGALSTKAELGFYENAERVINIPIMIISALGTVMMPHMAYSIHNKGEDYKKTIRFSMKLALNIASFSALGLVVVGKDLAVLLFGIDYLYSGYLIIILACTIVASAWSNVIRTQYLIPNSMDKIYVVSTIIGAVINLIFNIILIKKFGAVGACVGTILAEYSIVVYQTIHVHKYLEIKKYIKEFFECFLKAILTMALVNILGKFIDNIYLRIIFQIIFALLFFVLSNKKFIFREFLGISKKSKKHIKTEG